MVARQERRRRTFYNRIFAQATEPAGSHNPEAAGFEVRAELAAPEDGVRSSLVKLFDGSDELLIVPGRIVDLTGERAGELKELGFARGDLFAKDFTAELAGVAPNPKAAEPALTELQRISGLWQLGGDVPAREAATKVINFLRSHAMDRGRGGAAAAYGLITQQSTMPSGDPELTRPVSLDISPASSCEPWGAGSRVCVFDTGGSTLGPWATILPSLTPGDEDPLVMVDPVLGTRLGVAAGHGKFVGGLVKQAAPLADVELLRIADIDGLISEDQLLDRLIHRMIHGPSPDIVLLPFGGYVVDVAHFGAAPLASPDDWNDPVILAVCLTLIGIVWPGAVVVASAGNNASADPMFPAAYAARSLPAPLVGILESAGLRPPLVISVAAVDHAAYLADFSNYGDWVTACALGVRLRSAYVPGIESPVNDVDGHPEEFGHDSFARWSGTSFSAPLVAGVLAADWSGGGTGSQHPTIRDLADAHLATTWLPPNDTGCGVLVRCDRVASDNGGHDPIVKP